MDYNFHTHTFLCNHATETPEEYVKKAISAGIKRMGFSEHIPFEYPDGYQSQYRCPKEKAEEYVAEIKRLKEKYRDKIELHVGFEAEYMPEFFEKMREDAVLWGGEYFILGQHYIYKDYPDPIFSTRQTTDNKILKEYANRVTDAIKTGFFTYVAHPDIINFVGDEAVYENEMRKICVVSRENNIPLEINFLGIRDNRHYPTERFFKIVGEEKSPVVFGMDAHDAPSAGDLVSLKKGMELVEKYSLNLQNDVKLKSLKK